MAAIPIFALLEPLEKVSQYTALGIRFWDPASGTAITDGLEVTARPAERPHLRRKAFQTASGIYAFGNLPGLRGLETSDPGLPAGAHPLPASPPQMYRFVIDVNDRLGRFLPVSFQVNLPYQGIYPTRPAGSPPGPALPGFFLFSAPSRRTLSGLAVVRAQLVERLGPTETRPAKHAVVEVLAPDQTIWLGIADAHGAVAVIFPYPSFATSVAPQSPPSHPGEMRAQSWGITVRVHYRQASQAKPDSIAELPDLGAILAQPAAQLWLSRAGLGQPYLSTRLVFGQPVTLQTAGTSELWIET